MIRSYMSFLLLTVTLPSAKSMLSKRRSPYTLIAFHPWTELPHLR